VGCWEESLRRGVDFATPHRNLGLAYFNKLGDAQRARAAYEQAHQISPADARIFFELDQLYKKLNQPPAERLARLQSRLDLVEQRDDLSVELANLLLITGQPKETLSLLAGRSFHPWEGGEGKVIGAYVNSLVEIARRQIARQDFAGAVESLERAQVYPTNLGEGKLFGTLENHIFYYLGRAYQGLDQPERAREYFLKASTGLSEPTSALYYNDQPPHMIYYQGLAMKELGRGFDALALFMQLVQYGRDHLNDDVRMDYFAVSLPDFLVFDEDLNRRSEIHCRYMISLGYLGLGETEAARLQFDHLLQMNADHTGAHLHRQLLPE
jgi:tetratricopeptide (TPR) repeat protein